MGAKSCSKTDRNDFDATFSFLAPSRLSRMSCHSLLIYTHTESSGAKGLQFCSATYRLMKVDIEDYSDSLMNVEYKGLYVMGHNQHHNYISVCLQEPSRGVSRECCFLTTAPSLCVVCVCVCVCVHQCPPLVVLRSRDACICGTAAAGQSLCPPLLLHTHHYTACQTCVPCHQRLC